MIKRSASSIYKKMGFKADSEGMMKRYLNEGSNWDSHLENTKQFILKSAQTKGKGTALILGSGWHLDVPTTELLSLFNKVYFVDIAHPQQIKHKYRHNKNAIFSEIDVTGLAEQVYLLPKTYKKKGKVDLCTLTPNLHNWGLPEEEIIDFYVSVNMLNQLDILLLSYLTKHNIYSLEEINSFRAIIQNQHIVALPANKSCISTDCMEFIEGGKNSPSSNKQLIYTELPKGNFSDSWDWKFDLNGTYNKGKKTIFKVKAVDF